MEADVMFFDRTTLGKIALKKMKASQRVLHEDFRIYEAGWLESETHVISGVMEVKGGVFRRAKKGKNKGRLCMLVPNTTFIVYVLKEEIIAAKGTRTQNE